MKNACLVVDQFYHNEIFKLNSKLNRDNSFYQFFCLKELFFNYGYFLNTSINPRFENYDIVIYFDVPKVLPKSEHISKSYLLIFENELIRPDNWEYRKHAFFNKVFTWKDDIVNNKKYFKFNYSHKFNFVVNNIDNKKLCTLIASNKASSNPLELYSKRLEAIDWFEKNQSESFDFYGFGWDEYYFKNKYLRFFYKKLCINKVLKPKKICYKGIVNNKIDVLKNYKFAICYENAQNISGYITEKIFDCFFSGCVPIYWGANNINDYIPSNCFIDKRKYQTYEELFKYISLMDDSTYNNYLNNIEEFLNNDNSIQFRGEFFANQVARVILNVEK